ncbi:hypothetical protein M3Y94_01297300 [Aphelenchoides besseyi]|nr:hypothetical protein M3Y94_01297300 [Aphelenchoides besseyi]KAI6217634.1 hypothetical protein M3Y95_01210100 [Aphelenchoides besseyi]
MDFRRFVLFFGLLLSLALEARSGIGTDCIKGDGNAVEIGGKDCKKPIKAKIKVKSDDIHFKMANSDTKSGTISLKVGNCDLSGGVSGGTPGHFHVNSNISPDFPAIGKFSSNGVTFNNVQQKIGCTLTKTQVDDGFEVNIEYNPNNEDLPGLKITFDDAVLVNVEDANVDLWGVTGWRLWVTIGCCSLGAILLLASSICCSCKCKKNEKKKPDDNKKSEKPSKLKSAKVKSKKSKKSKKPAALQLNYDPNERYAGNKNWMIIEKNSQNLPVKKPDTVVDKEADKVPDKEAAKVPENVEAKAPEEVPAEAPEKVVDRAPNNQIVNDDPNSLDQAPGPSRQENQLLSISKETSKNFHWPVDSFSANDMLAMRQAGAANNKDVLTKFVESHPLPADALNKVARPLQKYAEDLEHQLQQPNDRPMEVEEDNLSMIQKLLPIINEKCAKQE